MIADKIVACIGFNVFLEFRHKSLTVSSDTSSENYGNNAAGSKKQEGYGLKCKFLLQ